MLPPFIIDQIRRREEELRRHKEAPRLELPLPSQRPTRNSEPDEDAERGVVVVDLG
jgi:hypothetical protein